MDSGTRGTLLIVDDDPLLLETLSHNLAHAGFAVRTRESGIAALEALDEETAPDLVVLDWKMPELSGLDTLKAMRERGLEIPVLFLTNLTDQIFEESALATGAVDFVDKSRSFSIIRHRIEIVLSGLRGGGERSRPSDETASGGAEPGMRPLTVGDLSLDRSIGRARWCGAPVSLTLTEFKIVERLAANAGRDVRYRDIYDEVHGEGFHAGANDDGWRSNVRGFMKRIRKKFKDVDDGFDRIENYPGFGYRWRDPET